MKLTELPLKKIGEVVDIMADPNKKRRLLDLGLTEGTEVIPKRRSPSGDPTAFLIRGTIIALRSEETDLIEVEKK
ncbi:ferrous iron transport protein A [Halanaerobacter jeridensis]|uniref:Ferrous iron transport protein A n=1 Tax=Halanaerobacter jeridensis TaxID=706427 RepID=A0A939BRG0_9FIRM|nr:FeoA family protein [Halanaerobacter jeridensis]MBM7557319.1 ferrous iron transport protein A [Halanaerobacter jeridensis]